MLSAAVSPILAEEIQINARSQNSAQGDMSRKLDSVEKASELEIELDDFLLSNKELIDSFIACAQPGTSDMTLYTETSSVEREEGCRL